MLIDGRSPDYFPERRADDDEIAVLVEHMDKFPYRLLESGHSAKRQLGSGMVRLGPMACLLWQSESYRKINFKRNPDLRLPTALIQIDEFVGVLEEPSGVVVKSQDEAEDLPLDAVSAHELLAEVSSVVAPKSGEISQHDADYFARKYPYLFVYGEMALTDVILEEYGLGRPVFYGLINRPEQGLVQDIVSCLEDGDVVQSADVEGKDEVIAFLSARSTE